MFSSSAAIGLVLTMMWANVCHVDALVDYFNNVQQSEVVDPSESHAIHIAGSCVVINPMRKPRVCSQLFADGYQLPFLKLLSWGSCIRVQADPAGGEAHNSTVIFSENMCSACSKQATGTGREQYGLKYWQAVPCPVGDTAIEYGFDVVNPWFFRLQVRNARIPVRKVEMLSQGRYQPLTRTADGFWVMGSGYWRRPYPMPLYLRLTALDGQVIMDAVYTIARKAVVEGRGRQFAVPISFSQHTVNRQ